MTFTLYNEECLNAMMFLPPQSVDMVMADLPYGTTQNKWDSIIPLELLWAEYKRICKGAIVLTALDPFSSSMVVSNLGAWKQTLVWEKNVASNFLNAKRQHLVIHENVLVFSFGPLHYSPQMSAGEPYVQKRKKDDDLGACYGKVGERTTTVNTGERYPKTVIRFIRETGLHPTQKPVALMEYLIRTYTNPGDTVLDNTMGSGTTGVACANTGRSFIGMEKDVEHGYFQIAEKRIRDAYELNSF